MSKKFEEVKRFYDTKQWGKKAVKNAVVKHWITAEEYKEIVGEDYE